MTNPDLSENPPVPHKQVSAKQVLQLCRRDAKKGEWQNIVDRTSDLDFCFSNPSLILICLQAAIRTGRHDIATGICRRSVNGDLPDSTKLNIIRLLIFGKMENMALRFFLDDKNLRKNMDYLRFSSMQFRIIKDKELRKYHRQVMASVSRGGSRIKPVPSSFRFEEQPAGGVVGSIRGFHSARTDAIHLRQFRRSVAKFKQLQTITKQPELVEYHHVFVDPVGQIWNERGQIIHPRSQVISVTDRTKVANIPVAFAAARMSSGIYHWLVDHLPGFAWIERSGILSDERFRILLNGHRSFEHETLKILDYDHAALGLTEPVFVERLLVARTSFAGLVGWRHLDSVIDTLGRRADTIASQNGVALPERVYITRRDAKRRPLVNEAEVEALAVAHGFAVQEFSAIPLWHQIAIARHADTILAPHGAGLAHMLFSKPGTKILELIPIRDSTYKLRFAFARLSLMRGNDHTVWLEDHPFGSDAWEVDSREIQMFLRKTLGPNRSALPDR